MLGPVTTTLSVPAGNTKTTIIAQICILSKYMYETVQIFIFDSSCVEFKNCLQAFVE